MLKKKIPLNIRKAIEEIFIESPDLFNYYFEDGFIIKFRDNDFESDFFFNIVKNYNTSSGEIKYLVEYKPFNHVNLETRSVYLTVQELNKNFKSWVNLLIEFNKESPIFDDYFSQKYYEELEPSFILLDNDAKYSPYTISQQETIVKFLTKIEEEFQDKYYSDDDQDVKEILLISGNLKKEISLKTKQKVFDGIRKILSKAFKISLEVGQKLLIEFTTELSKKLIMS